MPQQKPPYRVGALKSDTAAATEFYGFGVYVGDEMGSGLPIKNPKIELDNGKIVWGCECWWGPEDKIQEILKNRKAEGRTLVMVDPDDE